MDCWRLKVSHSFRRRKKGNQNGRSRIENVHDERNIPWDDGSADSVWLSNDQVELTGSEERTFSDDGLAQVGIETKLADRVVDIET